MRAGLFLFVFLALSLGVQAQSRVGPQAYPNSGMMQRMESSTKKAIAAVNEGEGRAGKSDPSLAHPMGQKTYEGNAAQKLGNTSASQNTFAFTDKVSSEDFRGTRSFLGIKNPWFGKKIYKTDEANLWSKSLIKNAHREFAVEDAETKNFYQSGKAVKTSDDIVETRAYLGKGSAQGALDAMSGKLSKKMTIEEVRELLNKNR